jgi:hypothetical protein
MVKENYMVTKNITSKVRKYGLYLLLISFLPQASIASSIDTKLIGLFETLNLRNISEYSNVKKDVVISKNKDISVITEGLIFSNRLIYRLLDPAVRKGNLDKSVLEDGLDWELSVLTDMQPSWEEGYRENYYPKYYTLPYYNFSKKDIAGRIVATLPNNEEFKNKIKSDFYSIFNRETPVYLNSTMFLVNTDDGIYVSELNGLTRYDLDKSISKTGTVIHVGVGRLSFKTLVHEYVHDRIARGIDKEGLGVLLGSDEEAKINYAFDLRESINKAYVDLGENYSKQWWWALADNDSFTSSYSFEKNRDDVVSMFSVNQFLEEVAVRLVGQYFYLGGESTIKEIIDSLPGVSGVITDAKIKVIENYVDSLFKSRKEVIRIAESEEEMIKRIIDETVKEYSLKIKNLGI